MRGARSIHLNQRRKLVAYLTCVMPVVVGGSTFGVQLEGMARMAFGCRMCVTCGGDPRTGTPGSGFVIAGEVGRTEKQRARKRGRREISDLTRAFFEEIGEDPDSLEPLRDTPCPSCGGFGFIPRSSRVRARGPITARPTGSSRTPIIGSGGGYYIAENAVPLCGSVGRYLAELRRRDELERTRHAQVVEVYIEHATEVPLWLMTPAGIALLKRTQYGSKSCHSVAQLEHALQFLDNERVAQRQNPDFERGRLIE